MTRILTFYTLRTRREQWLILALLYTLGLFFTLLLTHQLHRYNYSATQRLYASEKILNDVQSASMAYNTFHLIRLPEFKGVLTQSDISLTSAKKNGPEFTAHFPSWMALTRTLAKIEKKQGYLAARLTITRNDSGVTLFVEEDSQK